jgi:hypothetical protein
MFFLSKSLRQGNTLFLRICLLVSDATTLRQSVALELFGRDFQIPKPPFKPQYSDALARFSPSTHAYLENHKIADFTPKSLFLTSPSQVHANVRPKGAHVQTPSV